MNIFYLAPNPYEAAVLHCDKHVVKMILETCQILCTVHHRWNNHQEWMYKPTHQKHPSTLWAGDNAAHYMWLQQLGLGLCQEYTRRYGKQHSCYAMLMKLKEVPTDLLTSIEIDWNDPPQCMPDDCKRDFAIDGYRNYYRYKKNTITMKWNKDRDYAPDFMEVA